MKHHSFNRDWVFTFKYSDKWYVGLHRFWEREKQPRHLWAGFRWLGADLVLTARRWCSQWNRDNFTEHQRWTWSLCDHDGVRQKQDHLGITFWVQEHFPSWKMTKRPPVLAIMRDYHFFTDKSYFRSLLIFLDKNY